MENLKIVSLISENFKRLRAVEITPTGALVEITGPNGAGKTSVLDTIWTTLAGAKHIQTEPIRKGQKTARTRLNLGPIIVERRYTEKGTSLTVESAEGVRFPSPQTLLDALLGELTFDPLAFAQEEPREQFEMLRRVVPLDVDPDQLDGLNARDRERRTEINRDAKSRRAQADGIVVPDGLPGAPVDTQKLLDEIASAAKVNADIETRKGRRARVAQEAASHRVAAKDKRQEAARLRQEADRLERGAVDFETMATEKEAQIAGAEPLPDAVDVDAIRRALAAAEATNRGIDQRARKAELLAQAAAKEKEASELTETMQARDQAKTDAIAKAPMPVEGLGFGDGVVMFNGVPFEQASSAEQLRVSVAIAMAANPKLRVVRIKEGSLLDADNVALIAQMARERDYQVWIEKVDTSGKVGIVIEDGMVAAVNAPAETQA